MAKRRTTKSHRDYEHSQIEITGFPKETKSVPKTKIRDKLITLIKTKKKLRWKQIMIFFSYSGQANAVLGDLVDEGIFKKKKYDCGICEYFELAENNDSQLTDKH